MKILHVINFMKMGGGQSLLVELAPLQVKMGHKVSILQLMEPPDDTLIKKVKTACVEVYTLDGIKHFYDPRIIFKLKPYLDQFDIIHVHLFPAQYWVALSKLLYKSKTPIITTEHSTKNKRRNKFIFKLLDSFIYNRYVEVIACADKALETFHECYPNVKAISIPNGVDVNKYREAVPYSKQELAGISEDSFVVTMVARFIPSKRQDTLVEAITKLPTKFHAVLVGGQETDEGAIKIKNLCIKNGVSDRIHFLYLRGDVPQILKSSDAIVMSSEYEGLSLSSIEGMAGGRPFIASNVNGLREVVEGAGILVECANSDNLASELLKLESNIEYYATVVNRCLKRAAQYDIHSVAEKYINEYNKFVKYV